MHDAVTGAQSSQDPDRAEAIAPPGGTDAPEAAAANGVPAAPVAPVADEALPTTERPGRDLAAAIGVGSLMAGAVIVSLLVFKVAFVVLVVIIVGIGVVELAQALRPSGVRLPLIPMQAGVIGMIAGGYIGGAGVLAAALGLCTLAVCFWRVTGPREGFVRDITASFFVALYVPFLAAFAILMLRPEDGAYRVLLFAAVTVMSDVGGLAAGMLFGRHPLAPSISPKKTWEGLAGSAVLCLAVGTAGGWFLFDGHWLAGLVLGAVVTLTATPGDLVESALKRDLGIKDMGHVLPGHGGVMDRLDSLLPSALVSWIVLTLMIPIG